MGEGAGRDITEDDRFVVDGLEFVPSWSRPSVPGSLTLLKGAHMVPVYEELLAPYPNPRVVELGISQGGSVALLALLTRPTKLVAVELSAQPIAPLVDALRERGLDQTVKPYFGVDQADKDRLHEILDAEFADAPLDVVIDDASHCYEPTVASFEALFPRLRPGGVYVIEDWTGTDQMGSHMVEVLRDPGAEQFDTVTQHLTDSMNAVLADPDSPQRAALLATLRAGDGLADAEPHLPPSAAPAPSPPSPPVSRLALELALARAVSGSAVVDVHLDENWIVVHRGPAELDPRTFRIGDLYPDHFGLLTPVNR